MTVRLDIESLIKSRGSSSWTIRGIRVSSLEEGRTSLSLLMDCDRVTKLPVYQARNAWKNVDVAIRPFRYFCQGSIVVGWDACDDMIYAKIYLSAPMSVFWEGKEIKHLQNYPEEYYFPDKKDIVLSDNF